MKALKIEFGYSNQIELLDAVMSLYSTAQLKKELPKKEMVVLREYILSGYNEDSKSAIRLNLGISKEHLNVLNSKLHKKGFLKPHPHNMRMKVLNSDLLRLKDVFIDNAFMQTI